MLHIFPESILGGGNTLQQRLIGFDLFFQGRLLLLGAVQCLGQSGQLQLKIRVGVFGGAELFALLGKIGLQLHHLRLQLLLGGLGNCGSILCLLKGSAEFFLAHGKLLLVGVKIDLPLRQLALLRG